MTLFEFLGQPDVQPFSIAGVVVLLLLVVELAGLLLAGGSVGAALDDWLDIDHHGHLEHDASIETHSFISGVLTWLGFGKVPSLVALILLFGAFACIGLGLQALALHQAGGLASGWFIALPALIGGGLSSHWLGGRLARLVPKEESYAISPEVLLGQVARITIGPVDAETAGRALLTDASGNRHNVRVLAVEAGQRFDTGTDVLLATRQAGLFLVTAVPSGLISTRPREVLP